MNMLVSSYSCRICGCKETYNVNLLPYKLLSRYLYKSKEWNNVICSDCYGISHYANKNSDMVKYSDSSYRREVINNRPQSPISLPWSTITSLRSRHISRIINKFKLNKEKILNEQIDILDFGGYNGFTSYGLRTYFNIKNTTVADLDPNGLRIASALGMNVVDLCKSTIDNSCKDKFDLCISVHVIEHLENPSKQLLQIHKCLKNDGILYIEVPNMFGATFTEPAHLISFSRSSLEKRIKSSGYKILESGFTQTPKESINYGYPQSHPHENIYCLAKKIAKDNYHEEINLIYNDTISKSNKKKTNTYKNIKIVFLRIMLCNIRYMFAYPFNLIKYISYLLFTLSKEIIRLIISPVMSILFFIKNRGIFNKK